MNAQEELRLAALGEIRAHLAEYGAKNWALCRRKIPEISDRHFWRLVQAARSGKTDGEIMVQVIKKVKRSARKELPALPSPDYVAKGGSKALANINFMGMFRQLAEDVDLIRDWSSEVIDGKRQIKNAVFFVKQVQLLGDLIQNYTRTMRDVYDLEKAKEMWDAVVDEIARESPQCAERIMTRLAKLNSELGMTIHAKPEEEETDVV